VDTGVPTSDQSVSVRSAFATVAAGKPVELLQAMPPSASNRKVK
jgi:hypothetical protein